MLLDELGNQRALSIRLVGAPESWGKDLQRQYPFIEYLGELSDTDLEKEVASWSVFLNPVWWYSTGASTKLARAISWGVPIVTSTAGMRGYDWKQGALLVADTPAEMASVLLKVANDPALVRHWADQTRLIAVNGPSEEDLALLIKGLYL
jgi:glycosyltransferase involved in cell wall biosynthesis